MKDKEEILLKCWVKSGLNMRYKTLLIFGIVFCLLINYTYATGEFLNMSLADTFGPNSTYIGGVRDVQIDAAMLYISSVGSHRITKFNVSDPTNIIFVGSVTDTDGAGSLETIRRFSMNPATDVCYGSSYADDYLSLYDCSPIGNPTALGSVTDGTYLNGVWDVVFWQGNEMFAITNSQLSDYVSTWNVTNPAIAPVRINSYVDSAPPCSVDNPNDMQQVGGTSYVLATALIDDEITMLNVSAAGVITCLNSTGAQTSIPGSLEDPESFYFDNNTMMLYGLSRTDKQLSIYNWSNPSLTPTFIGNATLSSFPISITVATVGNDKYAFIGFNTTGAGIAVWNVTNPALPKFNQNWNTGAGSCVLNTIYGLTTADNYLYATSATDWCVYTIKLYDLITNAAPVMVSSRITPIIAYWNDTLMGYCNATDADNDTLYFNYTWIDSEEVVYNNVTPTIYSPGIEYQISNLSTGLAFPNIINFTCIAGDGTAESSVINYNITIAAKAPIPDVRITPDPAYSGGNLSGYCNTTDDPTKVVFFNYSWYKDGSLIYNGYYDSGGFGHPVGEEILLHTTENITSGNYTFSCNASDFYSHSATINTSILVTTLTDISFSISYPSTGCSNGLGCSTGGCSACTYCAFNFSSNNDDFQDCQGQISDNTSFYRFTNTGNVLITLIGSLNQSLNSALTLKYGYDPLLDDSGNNYTLTNNGTPHNATGRWYDFNGNGSNNGLIISSAIGLQNTAQMTACAWVKPFSKQILYTPVISGGNTDQAWQMGYYWYDTERMAFDFNGTGTAGTNMTPFINQWVHICGVKNSTHVIFYLNGVLNTSTANTKTLTTTATPVRIGRYSDNTARIFNGSIDNIRIFNRSLYDTQISQVYNNQSVTTDLVASWDFGDLDNFNISTTTFVSGLGVSAYKDVYLVGTVSAGLFGNYSYSLQVNSSES